MLEWLKKVDGYHDARAASMKKLCWNKLTYTAMKIASYVTQTAKWPKYYNNTTTLSNVATLMYQLFIAITFLCLALLALLVEYPLGDLSLQYLHIVRWDRINIIL